jgi:hypothetical protein
MLAGLILINIRLAVFEEMIELMQRKFGPRIV